MKFFRPFAIAHHFDYNIENVFNAFTCYDNIVFLKEKGLLKGVDFFPKKYHKGCFPENTSFINKKNFSLVQRYSIGSFKSVVKLVKNISYHKHYKFCIKSFNGKPIDFIFNLVFKFFEVSATNSTYAVFGAEYSKSKSYKIINFLKEYHKNITSSVFRDFEFLLKNYLRPSIQLDSILINSNVEKVFEMLIKGDILLKMPMFNRYQLTVEKKEGLIGSWSICKGDKSNFIFVIKSVETKENYRLLTILQKFGEWTSEIKNEIFSLDNNTSMLLQHFQITCPLSNENARIYKEIQNNIFFGIKEVCEVSE